MGKILINKNLINITCISDKYYTNTDCSCSYNPTNDIIF